jgi:hypothetical protein
MPESTNRRVEWLIELAKSRAVRDAGSSEAAQGLTLAHATALHRFISHLSPAQRINVLIPTLDATFEIFADEVDAEKVRH